MIDTFLIELIQFDKTGLIGKVFIPLDNQKIKSLSKPEFDHVFRELTLLLFDSGVCLPFHDRN